MPSLRALVDARRRSGREVADERAERAQLRLRSPGSAERAVGRDSAMMALAARQHGVVSVGQLAALGLGRGAVAHRVREGWLRRLHRGVFLVGPAPLPRSAEAAALLACGEGSLLSHASAATLWDLPVDAPEVPHVTVVGRALAQRPGLRVHRVAVLEREESAIREGLPVTSAGRTLLDIATSLTAAELDRALEHVLVHRVESDRSLAALLDRHQGARGVRALRTALEALVEPRLTRSEAERRLLALIRAARLPVPETNVRRAGHEVDVLWRDQSLVVEVDGYAYHGGRAAFERDRRRDADLVASGHRVLRVTWRQIAGEPEALVATLATTLAACGSPRSAAATEREYG